MKNINGMCYSIIKHLAGESEEKTNLLGQLVPATTGSKYLLTGSVSGIHWTGMKWLWPKISQNLPGETRKNHEKMSSLLLPAEIVIWYLQVVSST
jgi:hypothetical protein